MEKPPTIDPDQLRRLLANLDELAQACRQRELATLEYVSYHYFGGKADAYGDAARRLRELL